jgi:methionyl aminopeptidase
MRFALLKVGRMVALAIEKMRQNVQPGITTGQLDAICVAALARHGAGPTPRLV